LEEAAMKTALSTLAAGFALALSSAAFAGPAVTQWDQRQENLVREFSQGLGVDLAEAQPALLARADLASVGPTADARAQARRSPARALAPAPQEGNAAL
jgi:hypothetical protein